MSSGVSHILFCSLRYSFQYEIHATNSAAYLAIKQNKINCALLLIWTFNRLFNDAICNDNIDERETGNNFNGSGRDPEEKLKEMKETTNILNQGSRCLAKIRTKRLPNTSLERYFHTSIRLLCSPVSHQENCMTAHPSQFIILPLDNTE
jgi:hypothetical protein